MRRLWLFLFIVPMFAAPLQVRVNAKSAVLIDAENGRILFDKRAHELCFPASTTKVATALFALEKAGDRLSDEVEVRNHCLARMRQDVKEARGYRIPPYWLQPDGTKMGLCRGEKVSLESLLYGLMLNSGNDAANVIADHISGGITHFMHDLNLYLKGIGCLNTHFANPHGLHFPSHKSTAFDLAKMTSVALKNLEFRKIVAVDAYHCPKTNKSEEREFLQKNALLTDSRFQYAGALGVKTGGHSKAGYCLVAAAEREGRTLVAALFGSTDPKARYRDAIALFDAAFAEKKVRRKLYNAEENLFSTTVKKRPLKAVLREDIEIEYYPSEEPEVEVVFKWRASLPVSAGKKVGELHVEDERGELITSCDLFATDDITAPKNHLIWVLIFFPVPLIFGIKAMKKSYKLF